MYETLLTPKRTLGRTTTNRGMEEGNLQDAMGWYYSSMMANGTTTNGVWIYNLGVDPVQYSILRMGEMRLIYAKRWSNGKFQRHVRRLIRSGSRGTPVKSKMNPELNLTSNKENLSMRSCGKSR